MRANISVLVFVWLLPTYVGSAEQVLPNDLRAMPVLIQVPVPEQVSNTFVGTGIYLDYSNKVFLVTAKHNFFDLNCATLPLPLKNTTATLTTWTHDPAGAGKHILSINLNTLNGNGSVRKHPSRDIVAIEIGATSALPDGKKATGFRDGISNGPGSILTMLTFSVADVCVASTNVFDAAEVLMLGYPVELMERFVQVDFSRPLARKGIISQKNLTTGKFIVDSGVYGGNSGGPLMVIEHPSLDITKYKIAGIMVEFVPAQTRIFPNSGFTNSVLVFSGYSVAEPIDAAIELMNQ